MWAQMAGIFKNNAIRCGLKLKRNERNITITTLHS